MIEFGKIAPPAVWALVPVKPPSRAKTRLAGVLSAAERARLQKAMLIDVIRQLRGAQNLAHIAIVSSDESIQTLASVLGCRVLKDEPPEGGLNQALTYGAEELRRSGADLIVIVPADVPALDPAEIDLAVHTAMEDHALVVVPDRKAHGTNALIFPVASTPEFCFGEDSFRRHRQASAGRTTRPLPLASVAWDIDEPADLEALRQEFGKGVAPNTKTCLGTCGFADKRQVEEERQWRNLWH